MELPTGLQGFQILPGTAWLSDLRGTGTSGGKMQADGAAFEKQLRSEAAFAAFRGDTAEATKLNNEATVVENADNSLGDGTYDQQATESAWSAAESGNGLGDSNNLTFQTVDAQTKAAISDPTDDTSSLQNNLAAFVTEEKAAGNTGVATAAQTELTDLRNGNSADLSNDLTGIENAATAAGISDVTTPATSDASTLASVVASIVASAN